MLTRAQSNTVESSDVAAILGEMQQEIPQIARIWACEAFSNGNHAEPNSERGKWLGRNGAVGPREFP